MDDRRSLRLLLPRSLREFPADLGAVLLVVAATNVAVFTPVVSGTPVRAVTGVPFVLFVPGYALVAALFPASRSLSETGSGSSIDPLERIVLSVGLSIAIVVFVGLTLTFTPLGIRFVPVTIGLSSVTVSAVVVAAWRRGQLPEERRFRVDYAGWIDGAYEAMRAPRSRPDFVLNVLLAVGVVLATAGVGYAMLTPAPGSGFTELSMGVGNGTNYTEPIAVGETRPIELTVENHERATVSYDAVVVLQRATVSNGSITVLEQTELDRLRPTVSAGDVWRETYRVRPTLTGDHVRLAVLLYKDGVPDDPSLDNAYRTTFVWFSVEDSALTGFDVR